MSNDQIHNNLYLVVWNCKEIGKAYQVIEKWVFFKLLLQTYKQTHLGVRITVLPKILYIFYRGNLKNQINLSKSNITILNPLFSFCFRNTYHLWQPFLVVFRRLIFHLCLSSRLVGRLYTFTAHKIILKKAEWPLYLQITMFNVYFLMRLGQLLLTTRRTE